MAPTTEKTERPRVPPPPTTRRQEEEFEAEQAERQDESEPVEKARLAIHTARVALDDAEEALDSL